MEFAGYTNPFESEKNGKEKKKLTIPLPRPEAPPSEGVIFESKPRPLPKPLLEQLIKTEHHELKPRHKKLADNEAAPAAAQEAEQFGQKLPVSIEQDRLMRASADPELTALMHAGFSTDDADKKEGSTKPQPAAHQPTHVAAPIPPHAEQSPSLQEELAELLEEAERG